MAPTTGMAVTFRMNVEPDEAASRAQGRPIFREMEVCEIRLAGNPRDVKVFPAHEAEPNATRESTGAGGGVITYAMHYNEQYRAFKANEAQPVGGTPLSEAPFLTEAKRRELQALNIKTVETLAAIDGTPLKQLGMGGRELKNQAQAYLDAAAGSADVTAMAQTIASLQQQLADQRELMKSHVHKQTATKYQRAVERSIAKADADNGVNQPEQPEDVKPAGSADENDVPVARSIDDLSNDELKAFIKEETGEAVRGNPGRDTLIARANALLDPPEEDDAE